MASQGGRKEREVGAVGADEAGKGGSGGGSRSISGGFSSQSGEQVAECLVSAMLSDSASSFIVFFWP